MTLRPSDRPRVLLIGSDPATIELLEEWLVADGIDARSASADAAAGHLPDASAAQRVELLLVDVAYPRDKGVEFLRGVARNHPGTPVVVLSSGFFGNVECSGDCARKLGVAGVLPKPVAREALLAAVRGQLGMPG